MEIKDIEKLAELSRIALSDEEKERLLTDIRGILAFVDQIKEVAVDASPEGRVGAVANVMREDDSSTEGPYESGAYTETLLSAAPSREGQYFKVKKIL